METAMEEEAYTKVVIIIVGILAVVLFVALLDIMTGGTLFRSLICSMVWYLPLTGTNLVAYLNCGAVPL
ncbi:MAG: hypothetical protein V1818_03740 [Candidatus Aenigmatarchaeota archaeon]